MTPPSDTAASTPAFHLPLKGQFTGADARADRLIRQIRGEVEGLRQTLEHLSLESSELLEVDIAAALTDPETATTLPPPALVRAIVSEAKRADALAEKLTGERARTRRLRGQVRKMRLERAETNARLETLSEVIAALHANLEICAANANSPDASTGHQARSRGQRTLPPLAGRD